MTLLLTLFDTRKRRHPDYGIAKQSRLGAGSQSIELLGSPHVRTVCRAHDIEAPTGARRRWGNRMTRLRSQMVHLWGEQKFIELKTTRVGRAKCLYTSFAEALCGPSTLVATAPQPTATPQKPPLASLVSLNWLLSSYKDPGIF